MSFRQHSPWRIIRQTVQTLCSRAGTGGNNVPLVAEPVTLKIRSGCEGGGKGALWQRDMSATLGTHNDQTLFQPEVKAFGVCSKHSNAMMSDNPHSGFYEATTSRTLDQSGGNSVTSNQGGICVVAPAPETFDVRFTSDGTKNARGHCYPTEISRCLDTSEANPDSNHGGIAVVAPETYSLQGSMIGRADENGPQGDGINEDVCFTLNTTDRHAVAAPEPSFTISRDNHFAVSEDVSVTAVARGPATVAAPADHYCTSKNSHHTVAAHEQANTLVASDWKDPPLVNDLPNDEPVYIVRRLTPVECARLQGFPDWWCADLDRPMRILYSGLRSGRLGGRSPIPRANRKRKSRSENGWLTRTPIPQSTSCGATAWLCLALISCFPASHGRRRILRPMQQIVNRLILSKQFFGRYP